jgi:hypothetical protein
MTDDWRQSFNEIYAHFIHNLIEIVVQLKSGTSLHTQKHSRHQFDIIPKYIDYDEYDGIIGLVQFLILHTAITLDFNEGFKSKLIAKIAYIDS